MDTAATTTSAATPTRAALAGFRAGLYGCLTGWPDAQFELCDALLCAPSPVSSVPTLSPCPLASSASREMSVEQRHVVCVVRVTA